MITRRQVEDFLYREARLMDSHAYDEWFALWTEDALYWIPCNDDDHDRSTHVSLVHEDHDGLVDRITRLKSGAAWAQDPPSRLCRVVSNIEFDDVDGPECAVHSTFMITAQRWGRMEFIVGRCQHQLRVENGGLRMVRKKIVLVDNNDIVGNLTFLI
ncbi:MAG: aromatic-ring-hydroxylating dioxygenase subunit beta [Acidimicrobiia bacterium]